MTDQKNPIPGGKKVTEVAKVLAYTTIESQGQKGVKKYKIPLSTFNGRSPGQDLMEEIADATQYAVQLWLEREEMAGLLLDIWDELIVQDMSSFLDDETLDHFGWVVRRIRIERSNVNHRRPNQNADYQRTNEAPGSSNGNHT